MSSGKTDSKPRRTSAARPSRKAAPKKPATKRPTPARSARATPARSTPARASSSRATPARAGSPRPAEPTPPPPPAAAPPPPKKPSFYEAIAIYENGVRGLQRHDYVAAAESFRQVLDRYPEERELVERARLYLRVCERETAERPAGPQTTAERVYAATMSLSAGDSNAALAHVQRALDHEPRSHHAHYMMAVIRSTRAETERALEHLRVAIELNPGNRSLARKDSDLQGVRHTAAFKSLLDEEPGPAPPAPRKPSRARQR